VVGRSTESLDVMSADHEDAQAVLERKALRNARALVDKLENEQSWRYRGLAKEVAIVVFLISIVIAGVTVYGKLKPRPKPTPEMTKSEYVEHCLAKIKDAAKRDPRELDGLEGRALLTLRVRRDGYADIEITKSSGEKLLDDRFFRLARFAQPFGQLPATAISAGGTLEISRVFRAERGSAQLLLEPAPAGKP
jgi:hypothetical protein